MGAYRANVSSVFHIMKYSEEYHVSVTQGRRESHRDHIEHCIALFWRDTFISIYITTTCDVLQNETP